MSTPGAEKHGALCLELQALMGEPPQAQVSAFLVTTLGLLMGQLHENGLIDANELISLVAPNELRSAVLPAWCKAYEILVHSADIHPRADR